MQQFFSQESIWNCCTILLARQLVVEFMYPLDVFASKLPKEVKKKDAFYFTLNSIAMSNECLRKAVFSGRPIEIYRCYADV